MNWKSKLILLLALLILGISTVACEKEGPVEQAGKEIDNAFNAVKKEVNKVTE